MIQVSAPLIAGQAEFDRIVAILREVLGEAGDKMEPRSPARG